MCGISFAFRPDLQIEQLDQLMDRSLVRMTHRGPDGQGKMVRESWALGNRRLAVIDIPGGDQPLSDATERYHLSYNGELYNYIELRDRLQDGWSFRTNGDTEVVLAGLVLYGTDFLGIMEGMWAIALWDRDENRLLLVRDRMGQKPIYFQSDTHRFACASELPSLRPLSWHNWQPDERSSVDYLRYGFCLPGTTFYKKVHEVLPGHWVQWSPGQVPRQEAYWRLSPGGFMGNQVQARDTLKRVVIQSVERRLVSDVEVGALLSGGVDSSVVTAVVTKTLGRPLKTFTIGFDDPTFDESRHARRMAEECGSTHYFQQLTLGRHTGFLERAVDSMGQPFADGSILPTAMVSQLAAEHVKVVVSGDGGDELFSGYQRYTARAILRWYTRLPHALRKRARAILAGTKEPGDHHSASFMKMAHLFFDAADRMAVEAAYVAPTFYTSEDLRRLVPDLWRMGHHPSLPGKVTGLEDLHAMMAADSLIYLPQDILAKVDRAGMAFSLEVRSPFLDRKVVELAFSVPRKWHRHSLTGKQLLHAAFCDLVPQWVWRRRKHGFGVPLHRWFRSGLQDRLAELLSHPASPLYRPFVEQMISDHITGRRDHGQRLWQLYIYLRWLTGRSWQTF